MHLVAGFIRIMLAHVFAWMHNSTGADAPGRLAVRLCCRAYFAGAGIDDEAVGILRRMGPNGRRLLKEHAARTGDASAAALVLKILNNHTRA